MSSIGDQRGNEPMTRAEEDGQQRIHAFLRHNFNGGSRFHYYCVGISSQGWVGMKLNFNDATHGNPLFLEKCWHLFRPKNLLAPSSKGGKAVLGDTFFAVGVRRRRQITASLSSVKTRVCAVLKMKDRRKSGLCAVLNKFRSASHFWVWTLYCGTF